ncbi:hypothetical protein A3Q56_07862 [Intoshia linei]|uniref:Scavenger receptor class B member 1 n=1 Tax=Intoshia linei TaxID=1819745 RepID=A0A177AQY8_9BILA|nr:hypothetical protein A3Q56_07862 [Intoshia linei]
MKMTCSCKRCCIFSILAFSLLILIFGLVTWLVLPTLISKLVRKNLIISTKSSIYDMWVKPTVPIYFTFEFFIVTNRDDIFKGEKPILKKTGPYVYIKERIKKNVVFNSNETVSFNYQNFYYFQKNLSIGPETDMYVFVDFVTAASLSVHYYANETGKMDVFTIFDYPFNTQFFMNMSVNQYIFGYQHPAMMKLNKMYRMHETTEFGVLADDTLRNGSFSKTFEVWTGSDNVHPIGEFASWDYKNYLTYWNTKESNMINGTDGSSWSPGIKRDDILQLFSPELCRSVSLAYENDSSVLGISTFKFVFFIQRL